MLIMAFRQAMQTECNRRDELLQLFSRTMQEVCEGQQYDVNFETRDDVGVDEYLEMIRLKTSVLLGCAVRIGAMLAGAPAEDVESLYRFGEAMGLAFQLQDDYLDVYGDSAVFGKEIGGDIMCNKKTYMLINALAEAEGDDKVELQRWIDTVDADRKEKVAAVTAIYDKLGIDRMAKAKMEEYYKVALAALDEVNVTEERKQPLREYAAKMMKRNK